MSLSQLPDPELRRLLRALSLSQRYHLYLVECPSPIAADMLVAALDKTLAELRGEPVTVVRLAPPATIDIVTLDQLMTEVFQPLLDPPQLNRRQGCIHVIDVTAGGRADASSWALGFARWNERRNEVQQRLAGEIIVALPPSYQTVFAHHAPDVWSTRSGSYVLASRAPGTANSPASKTANASASLHGTSSVTAAASVKMSASGNAHGSSTASGTLSATALITQFNGVRYAIEHDASPSTIATVCNQLREALRGQRDETAAMKAVTRMSAVADWLALQHNAEAEVELRVHAVRLARQLVIEKFDSALAKSGLQEALNHLANCEAKRGWHERASARRVEAQHISQVLGSAPTSILPAPQTESRPGRPRAGALHLSNDEQRQLADAISAAFPSQEELLAGLIEHLPDAAVALGTDLGDEPVASDTVTVESPMGRRGELNETRIAAQELVAWAASFGRLLDVAQLVFAERPGHEVVRKVAEQLGLAPSTAGLRTLYLAPLNAEAEETWATLASVEAALGRLVTRADGRFICPITPLDDTRAITANQALPAQQGEPLHIQRGYRWTAAGIMGGEVADTSFISIEKSDLALFQQASHWTSDTATRRKPPTGNDIVLLLEQANGGPPAWYPAATRSVKSDTLGEPGYLQHGRIEAAPGTPCFDLDLGLLAINLGEGRAAVVPPAATTGRVLGSRIRLQHRVLLTATRQTGSAALEATKALLLEDGWLQPVETRQQGFDIHLNINENDRYEITDPSGARIAQGCGLPAPQGAIAVLSIMEHHAKYQAALSLLNTRSTLHKAIEMHLQPAGATHRTGAATPQSNREGDQPTISDISMGEPVVPTISNAGPGSVYLSLLHFGADGSIRLHFDNIKLAPNSPVSRTDPLQLATSADKAVEWLKLFVTRRPHDLRPLLLNALGQQPPTPFTSAHRFSLTPLLQTFQGSLIPYRYRVPFVATHRDWGSINHRLRVITSTHKP